MASIRKKKGSKYWFAAYYREDGSRTQTSTRTTDRKEALRIANDLEDAHQRRATEGQMRRVLSNLNERLAGQPLASATLKEFVAQWLVRKKGEIKPVTYASYRGASEEFVEMTPAKANMGIQYVTVADVAAYRNRCAEKASAKTANNKLKIIRVLFQTAWRDGFVTENVASKVEILTEEDSNRRPFTLPELQRAFAVADGEWRGMMLAGLYTGQRLKDVASLRRTCIDLQKMTLSLRTSKTDRHQEIPIAAPLGKYFAGLEAGDDPRSPIFPESFKLLQKDGHVSRLSQQFYEILVTAGLAVERLSKNEKKGVGRDGKRQRSELTFHSLRHTATSLLKNAGVSASVVQDIIGHDSAEMSRHYTHIDEAAKRVAMSHLPDVTATVIL